MTRRNIRQEAEQREYGRIMPTEMPAYLALGIEIKVMARFRCGSEERGSDSWRTEKERMCRICGTEEETVWHLISTCCPADCTEEEILNVDGRGLAWMKDVYKCRNEI